MEDCLNVILVNAAHAKGLPGRKTALLTELGGEFSQFRGQITMCVVTVSARDRSRGCSAGSVVVGGVAAWVA
jgi:hypothetical protein